MLKYFEKNPKSDLVVFVTFTFLAFWMHHLSHSAILSYSFKPIEVFLHEASHGLATLLTGNSIVSLHLEWREGHVVSGFIGQSRLDRIIVAFCGYAGASLWGFLIYATSVYSSKAMKILLIAFSSYFFLYIDGLTTGLILGFVIAVFLVSWYAGKAGSYFLRFLGIFVMLNSIYSPTYLWAYNRTGDHVAMSQLMLLPSFIFIIVWVVLGLLCFWFAYKMTAAKTRAQPASE